jgi:hypothetical protein
MAPLFPSSPMKVDAGCLSDGNHTATDPKYTTMIISGAVGDVERNDNCPGDASLASVTTACSSAYGYGVMTVVSATELRWDFTAWSTPIGVGSVVAPPVDYTDTYTIKRSAPPA